MSIVNISKPSSSISNSSKINIGETWDSNDNQWQNEARTWDSTVSIISNSTRTSSSMTNLARP